MTHFTVITVNITAKTFALDKQSVYSSINMIRERKLQTNCNATYTWIVSHRFARNKARVLISYRLNLQQRQSSL